MVWDEEKEEYLSSAWSNFSVYMNDDKKLTPAQEQAWRNWKDQCEYLLLSKQARENDLSFNGYFFSEILTDVIFAKKIDNFEDPKETIVISLYGDFENFENDNSDEQDSRILHFCAMNVKTSTGRSAKIFFEEISQFIKAEIQHILFSSQKEDYRSNIKQLYVRVLQKFSREWLSIKDYESTKFFKRFEQHEVQSFQVFMSIVFNLIADPYLRCLFFIPADIFQNQPTGGIIIGWRGSNQIKFCDLKHMLYRFQMLIDQFQSVISFFPQYKDARREGAFSHGNSFGHEVRGFVTAIKKVTPEYNEFNAKVKTDLQNCMLLTVGKIYKSVF